MIAPLFHITRSFKAAHILATLLALDGQSNMLGAGFISDFQNTGNALDNVRPVVTRQFQRVFILNPTTLQFEKLQAGQTNLAYGQALGPEIGIAQRWENENPTGVLYIVKTSRAGRPIADWARGQDGYTELTRLIPAAKARMISMGLMPVLRGFIWSQGESDAWNANYANELQTFTNNLFADGHLSAATKVVIFKMRGGATVATQQQLYVNNNPSYARAIETVNYTTNSDNLHYNANAQYLSGYTDAYNAVFGLNTAYPFPM